GRGMARACSPLEAPVARGRGWGAGWCLRRPRPDARPPARRFVCRTPRTSDGVSARVPAWRASREVVHGADRVPLGQLRGETEGDEGAGGNPDLVPLGCRCRIYLDLVSRRIEKAPALDVCADAARPLRGRALRHAAQRNGG